MTYYQLVNEIAEPYWREFQQQEKYIEVHGPIASSLAVSRKLGEPYYDLKWNKEGMQAINCYDNFVPHLMQKLRNVSFLILS